MGLGHADDAEQGARNRGLRHVIGHLYMPVVGKVLASQAKVATGKVWRFEGAAALQRLGTQCLLAARLRRRADSELKETNCELDLNVCARACLRCTARHGASSGVVVAGVPSTGALVLPHGVERGRHGGRAHDSDRGRGLGGERQHRGVVLEEYDGPARARAQRPQAAAPPPDLSASLYTTGPHTHEKETPALDALSLSSRECVRHARAAAPPPARRPPWSPAPGSDGRCFSAATVVHARPHRARAMAPLQKPCERNTRSACAPSAEAVGRRPSINPLPLPGRPLPLPGPPHTIEPCSRPISRSQAASQPMKSDSSRHGEQATPEDQHLPRRDTRMRRPTRSDGDPLRAPCSGAPPSDRAHGTKRSLISTNILSLLARPSLDSKSQLMEVSLGASRTFPSSRCRFNICARPWFFDGHMQAAKIRRLQFIPGVSPGLRYISERWQGRAGL